LTVETFFGPMNLTISTYKLDRHVGYSLKECSAFNLNY
jgi:hypothetical protein